jgi:1-acyl-sn-glycerol-3-phosphate acyltransferase
MDDWKYQPARDQHLPPDERLRSLQREIGLPAFLSQFVWRFASSAYLRLYHRLTILGRERLPARAPFVMIANHSSHLDALTLAAALPWRLRQYAFPIAAGDVFFQTNASAYFSALALNALPMWRKRCGTHALDELRTRLVSDPAIYILFPEGTRTRDGTMGRFKPGLGRMIAGADVPVAPCHLEGAFRALPPGRHFPLPHRLTLRIGEPMSFAELPDARAGWETITARLEEAVAALGAAAAREGGSS